MESLDVNETGETAPNGAETLVRTLVDGGVDVCFANPGTSEMHFVAALDRNPDMRCVLALFEGVATGAADGYARMAEKPAATLLHLGPGLANGLANLHNATKAATPVVNVVGEHATWHRELGAPLTADIEGAARPFSGWVRTSPNALSLAADGAAAIAAARTPPGQVATLILPGDSAWNPARGPAEVPPVPPRAKVTQAAVEAAAAILRSGEPTLLLLTGHVLREAPLVTASRIAAKTGATLLGQTFNSRMERGAGRVNIDRVPYPVDEAVAALRGYRNVILVGSKPPVGFFAYPTKPSRLTQPGVRFHVLATPAEDGVHALEWLADEVGAAKEAPPLAALRRPAPATGAITPEALGQSLASLLPDNAIVVDEGVTVGRAAYAPMAAARPHDWLQNMGGSIGFGPPQALGAAIACPDRKVVAIQADGSCMYTLQALWSQAREGTDVITVLFANRTYAILRHEFGNVGIANPGPKAMAMTDLGNPELDWVLLARGMGVPAERVESMDQFNKAFDRAVETSGPTLIEVML